MKEMKKSKIVLISTAFLFLIILTIDLISGANSCIIKSIDVSSTEVAPGESFETKIEIENEGNIDIENVILRLDLEELPFIPKDSSIEKIIDKIKEDDEEKVKFEIEALPNAESGTYKIPFYLEYENITKKGIIGITVNSEPEIILEREDGLLLKGQKNELKIKIINKGLSDIKFLEIKGKEATGYNMLSSNYLYIGDIDTNDFDTAEFEIFIDENYGKIMDFYIEITYKDVTNKEYKENLTINLKVYDLEEAYSLGLLDKNYTGQIVSGIIILTISLFIYRKIRKAKKFKNKKQNV